MTTPQTVKIQLVRSPIGTKQSHRDTVRGLGLRGVNSERVLEDTVLLDPLVPRYVRLNASGAVLWDALAEPKRARELAAMATEIEGLR